MNNYLQVTGELEGLHDPLPVAHAGKGHEY
jgi:hypothetical protein